MLLRYLKSYICNSVAELRLSINGTECLDDKHVYLSEIYCKEGDEVREVKSSLDRSGHVIVVAETPQVAIEKAEDLINKVKFEIL